MVHKNPYSDHEVSLWYREAFLIRHLFNLFHHVIFIPTKTICYCVLTLCDQEFCLFQYKMCAQVPIALERFH